MRSKLLMLLLMVWSTVGFAGPETAKIQGIVDLSRNQYSQWPYAGHYTEKFKVIVIVKADASGVAQVDFGKYTEYDEGGFRHDYCRTHLHWPGGEIEAQLLNPVTGMTISSVKRPMTLATDFSSPTTEWATCYPHDYPNFTQAMTLSWDSLDLKIDESRTLKVRPFTYLDYFTLWGTGSAYKQNGEYILQSFSIADGLRDTIYSPDLKKEVPALSFMAWDHYNSKHVMPLPGQADAHGVADQMSLIN